MQRRCEVGASLLEHLRPFVGGIEPVTVQQPLNGGRVLDSLGRGTTGDGTCRTGWMPSRRRWPGGWLLSPFSQVTVNGRSAAGEGGGGALAWSALALLLGAWLMRRRMEMRAG